MSKKAVDKIVAGLRDAIAIARGEIKSARIHVQSEMDLRSLSTVKSRRGDAMSHEPHSTRIVDSV